MHAAVQLPQERRDLASMLSYRNEDVLFSFCDALDIQRDEAEIIFQETLKFLWLCHVDDDKAMRTIDSPILILDEMWHTFVLFTREYHEFSHRYFGHYLHHAPTTRAEKESDQKMTPELREALVTEQRERYSKIYDLLGRETFLRWFYEFPEKYSPQQILKLRKK